MIIHLLYRNLPPSDRAPLWLKQGRKEGHRIQHIEPQVSGLPEAFPAQVKPRLNPKDL